MIFGLVWKFFKKIFFDFSSIISIHMVLVTIKKRRKLKLISIWFWFKFFEIRNWFANYPNPDTPKIKLIELNFVRELLTNTAFDPRFTIEPYVVDLDHAITVLTNDSYPPYDRPKLSKKIDVDIAGCLIRNEQYFQENGITFKTNQTVNKIDFNTKVIACESGDSFSYDKLVISSGSKASDLAPTPGAALHGIFTLRSLENARAINSYFSDRYV